MANSVQRTNPTGNAQTPYFLNCCFPGTNAQEITHKVNALCEGFFLGIKYSILVLSFAIIAGIGFVCGTEIATRGYTVFSRVILGG